jgi:hypothetical protein
MMPNIIKKFREWLHGKKILLALPVALLLPSVYGVFHSRLEIFPFEKAGSIEPFCDSSETPVKGCSRIIQCVRSNDKISFSYRLCKKRGGYNYPYAGFAVYFRGDSGFCDIRGCKTLVMVLDSQTTPQITVSLKYFIKEYSDLHDENTLLHCTGDLYLSPGTAEHRIEMENFIVADWWLQQNNLSQKDVGKPDYAKLNRIEITNATMYVLGKDYNLTVRKIYFERDNSAAYFFSLVSIILYLGVFLLPAAMRKRAVSPTGFKGISEKESYRRIE